MKKIVVIFFVLVLSLLVVTLAFAQDNKLAYFKIDSDIGTAGFQGGYLVENIGGGERVGFAIYVKNVDQLRTCCVDFTWEGSKATFSSDSGFSIELDERKVNGAEVTLSEDSVLALDGSGVSGAGEVSETGHYAIDFTKMGADAVVTTEYGLIYLFVLKTETGFTTSDSFAVTAKVAVLNDSGIRKEIGKRNFYVNGAVDVETSTWGEIKNQFKD